MKPLTAALAMAFSAAVALGITLETVGDAWRWDRVADLDVSHYQVRACLTEAEATACVYCARPGGRSFCDERDRWCKDRTCQEWRTRPCVAYSPGRWEVGSSVAQTPEGIQPRSFWDPPTPCPGCWWEVCLTAVDFDGNGGVGCPSLGERCDAEKWNTS